MKKEKFKHNHKNRPAAREAGLKTCFVTKEVCPRAEMLRFALAPGRQIIFDVAEKLPGHGFWLKADKDLLEKAITKRIFYKAAKGTVDIPAELQGQVEASLRGRCLNLMSLCRKAGLLVFGYEAVKKAVGQGDAVIAFEADNSSLRGQNKIFKSDDNFPIYTFFSRADLGSITGMNEVVHIALLKGKLSEQATAVARKLNLYYGEKQKG